MIVRDGMLVLATSNQEVPLFEVNSIALVQTGKLQVENILAAAAVAWALDLSPDLIRAGIESFEA